MEAERLILRALLLVGTTCLLIVCPTDACIRVSRFLGRSTDVYGAITTQSLPPGLPTDYTEEDSQLPLTEEPAYEKERSLVISTEYDKGCVAGHEERITHGRKTFTSCVTSTDLHHLEGVHVGAYIYEADRLPNQPNLCPSLSNGHLGTVVHGPAIHMNGLYNGGGTSSHRAVIPSSLRVSIAAVSATPMDHHTKALTYKLNALKGVYEETLNNSHWTVTQRMYAHKNIPALLVLEVDVIVHHLMEPFTIFLNVFRDTSSPDIDFYRNISHDSYIYREGRIKTPETASSQPTPVHMIQDIVPDTLLVARGETRRKWLFLTAIHAIKHKAWTSYKLGGRLTRDNMLLHTHVEAMTSQWSQGRIDIEGDLRLARVVTGSLFYTLSSLPVEDDPDWPFIGLSPNGLPVGANKTPYWGHVFWDQDTWMFPPILALHSNLGEILIKTRRRTKMAARRNAQRHGRQGLQYPWESAFTGAEVTTDATLAAQEVHVSGDVAMAMLQYWWATGNDTVLQDEGFGAILLGIADFWTDMMVLNKTSQLYDITNVTGPDEYYTGVNNSVYTNALAKVILTAAETVATLLNVTSKPDYKHFADNMYIPFDDSRQYHPEFDGFIPGTRVKQADVILLGFPLMAAMTEEVRRNDLSLYQNTTNPLGPAMTWSMFTIGWLELAEEAKAQQNLEKSLLNVANEFQVWSEVIHGEGAPNFITGMGGFLQSILFGYGGLRNKPHKLEIKTLLPPNCTKMSLIGLDYRGSSFDVIIETVRVTMTMTSHPARAAEVVLRIPTRGMARHLRLDIPVVIIKSRNLYMFLESSVWD